MIIEYKMKYVRDQLWTDFCGRFKDWKSFHAFVDREKHNKRMISCAREVKE